jgi:hypothetical protein
MVYFGVPLHGKLTKSVKRLHKWKMRLDRQNSYILEKLSFQIKDENTKEGASGGVCAFQQ